MVLKPSEEFLRQAFTNNTFGDKETEISIRAVLDNSFSYLYRLQRNLVQYEEYFYTTRNRVYHYYDPDKTVDDNPEMGDFYLDDKRRVCVDFPVELIQSSKREDYRVSQLHHNDPVDLYSTDFYGKEISYETLIENNKLFYRIPVLIIDSQVLRDFKVRIYDDHFVVIFPFDKYFMYDKRYDENHKEYYFVKHDYVLQIINNTNSFDKVKFNKNIGFFDIKTNRGMLQNQANNNEKPFGFISRTYLDTLFKETNPDLKGYNVNLYDKKEGSYFAVVYGGDEKLGSMLLDVEILEDGIQIDFDKSVEERLKSPNLTIRFIFYRYLHKHTTLRGDKYISSHEVEEATISSYDNKVYSDVFLIRENEDEFNTFPTTYDMPIPSEDLMLFRVKTNDIVNDNKTNWSLIPNTVVQTYYPYLYQVVNEKEIIYIDTLNNFYYTEDGRYFNPFHEHVYTKDVSVEELKELILDRRLEKKERYCLKNLEPGDKMRVYYFYYPGYDLHFTHMYEFFYKYLYFKFGQGSDINLTIEEIINGILFGSITLSDDTFKVDEELLKEMVVRKNAIIELNDSELEINQLESTINLFLGSTYTIENGNTNLYFEDITYTDEEKLSIVINRFLDVFNFVVKHPIVDYHYDDIDYLKTIENAETNQTLSEEMTALQYRVKRLKEFIKDDPEALRKYVLCQNKVSIKYDFFVKKEEMEKRIRTQTEGKNPTKFVRRVYHKKEEDGFYDEKGRHFTLDGEYDPDNNIPLYELGEMIENEEVTKEVIDDPMYLFVFERLNKAEFLSCRIFVEGFIYTNYIQKQYDYQDFIYIPTWALNEGDFVEIETFPTYREKDIVVFTEEVPSYTFEYHENEFVKPTLSDLFFKNPENDNEYYDEDDFKLEYINDAYNYYKENEETEIVFSLIEKKDYYSGDLVDLGTGHHFICVNYYNEINAKSEVELNKGYLYYDESGRFIQRVREDQLPENLSRQYYKSVLYRSNDGDYYAKDYNYKDFYHYSSNNELLEERSYTRDEVLQLAEEQGLSLGFSDVYVVQVGKGYYNIDGKYFTHKGQHKEEYDVPKEAIEEWVNEGKIVPYEIQPTGHLLSIDRDRFYKVYSVVLSGGSVINTENTKMSLTPMKLVRITLLNEELYGKEIEVSIRKDSIFQFENLTRISYPCLQIGIRNQSIQIERYVDEMIGDYYEKDTYTQNFYHYNSNGYRTDIDEDGNYIPFTREQIYPLIEGGIYQPYIDAGSNEFIRVFRSGRMLSKNRYELLLNDGKFDYGYPRVQFFERIEPGETVTVDVTPYRNHLVYYRRVIEDDFLVDLRGYINKPFDLHYYEVYLNGRRISRNNIFPISPFEFKLAGVHSIYNLEIYEKDRDWEYYGCDINNYYTVSDLIDEIFMESKIKDKVVDDITGPVPPNHICEDELPWERDLDIESLYFEIFYYDRLLPLEFANGDDLCFNENDIHFNFPVIHRLYFRYGNRNVTNGEFNIQVKDKFEPVHIDFVDYVLQENPEENTIIYNRKINDVQFIILQVSDIYKLYTGPSICDMTECLTFSIDFPITGSSCIHLIHENNIWMIVNYNTDIYYRSTDAKHWFRYKASFQRMSKDYTFHPYIIGYFKDKFSLFGEILVDDDVSPKFECYGLIESEDGIKWTFRTQLSHSYLNKDNMTYIPYHHILYTSTGSKDYITTNGTLFTELDLSNLYDFKNHDLATITNTIIESNGIYYAGRNSQFVSLFNYTIYSIDGIKWRPLPNNQYITDIIYTNKVWFMIRKDFQGKYIPYISIDGTHFDTKYNKSFSFEPILFSDEKGFYIIKDTTFNESLALYVGVKQSDETVTISDNTLLLDPDIYFRGDDKNRWNVYMTGNDEEFMDKSIKEEILKKN